MPSDEPCRDDLERHLKWQLEVKNKIDNLKRRCDKLEDLFLHRLRRRDSSPSKVSTPTVAQVRDLESGSNGHQDKHDKLKDLKKPLLPSEPPQHVKKLLPLQPVDKSDSTNRKQLVITMVLMIILACGLYLLVHPRAPGLDALEQLPIPNVWRLACLVTSCNKTLFVHQPRIYPRMDDIGAYPYIGESNTRLHFYVNFIAVTTFFFILPIVMLVRLLVKPKEMPRDLEVSNLIFWIVSMELLDWIVIIVIAWKHGTHYRAGLYWEDWITLYVFIWVQSVAECMMVGDVKLAGFLMSVMPVSSRAVRFKDKIQVALLIACPDLQPMGALRYFLAGWSVINTLLTQQYMTWGTLVGQLLHALSGQFFIAFVQAPSPLGKPDTFKDWILSKLEPMTRNGVLLFAVMHETQQALISLIIWGKMRGSYFIIVSFTLSMTKPALLPLGRLFVLQLSERWVPLYHLRAEMWKSLSQVIEFCSCCKSKCWMSLIVCLRNSSAKNMHLIASSVGATKENEALLKKTLESGREVLGDKHPGILTTKHYLAQSYHTQKRLKEAVDLLREVLEARIDVLPNGDLNPDTIHTKSTLASCLNALGQEQEAAQLQRDVLDNRIQVLGPDHPDTLKSQTGLADRLRKMGQVKEAERMLRQALSYQTRRPGERHPNTLFTKTNLANALSDLGQAEEGEQKLREVLKVQEQVLGPRHPNTLSTQDYLAVNLRNRGQTSESIQLLQHVLQMRIDLHHPLQKQLATKSELAESLAFSGDSKEAEKFRREVHEALEEDSGLLHADTLRAKASWACSLRTIGKHDAALDTLLEVLKAQNDKLGPTHPDTLDTKSKLSISLQKAGRKEEAVQLVQEVLDERSKMLGPTHPNTLKIMSGLADGLRSIGKIKEGVDMMRQVLDRQILVLGEKHPNTLFTKSNLGHALADPQVEKKVEAVNMLRDVLKKQVEVLGERHRNTLTSKSRLAEILAECGHGHVQEAIALQHEVWEAHSHDRGPRHPMTIQAAEALIQLWGCDEWIKFRVFAKWRDRVRKVNARQVSDSQKVQARQVSTLHRQEGLPSEQDGSLSEVLSYIKFGRGKKAAALEQRAADDVEPKAQDWSPQPLDTRLSSCSIPSDSQSSKGGQQV